MKLLVKNLLFTALVPGTVAVFVPLSIVAGRVPCAGVCRLAGSLVLVAGVFLYAWCVWDFATFGRGTPAPIDAPTKLVVHGPYRHVRNPMYVAVLTVVLGWASLYAAMSLVLYATVVGCAFQLFIVGYEEPHLRRIFAGEYDAYCARVGRWLPRRGASAGPVKP